MNKFAVIGSGAWGTALAAVLVANGKEVILRTREQSVLDDIKNNNENSVFLPNIKFKAPLKVTLSLQKALEGAEAVLMAAPAQYVRDICRQMKDFYPVGLPLVICSKGIELSSGLLMSEVVAEELPMAEIAVLSGPSFAAESAAGKPTLVTIACRNEAVGKELVSSIGSMVFRPYYSSDIIGVQIGGAVKNVLAIAAGVVEGKNLGDNTRAAMITRGLAEVCRLAKAMGANEATLMGMSGIGDLILTANSKQSRNYSVGFKLGQEKSLAEIMEGRITVAEGVYTASAVCEMAQKIGVELPICSAVDKVLKGETTIDDTIKALLSRPFKTEGK